jgi:DNA-binding FadR family transcriptional regulator
MVISSAVAARRCGSDSSEIYTAHIYPLRGAFVTGITRAEVRDVFELRGLIEPRLLCASLLRMSEEDFRALEATHAAYAAVIEASDKALYGVVNAEFHMGLYKWADRPRSQRILRELLQASDRYTRVEHSEPKTCLQRVPNMPNSFCSERDLNAMLECLTHIGGVRDSLDLRLV